MRPSGPRAAISTIPHMFAALAARAGLRVIDIWTDAHALFSVQVLKRTLTLSRLSVK